MPDLENMFVWLGDGKPPNVRDILQKSSYENHKCRVFTGILTSADLFEGTGTPPRRGKENQQASVNTAGSRRISDFFGAHMKGVNVDTDNPIVLD